MLLIDGAKYQEWTLDSEDKLTEDDLEQMVIEHSDDIFGEDSIYLDKKYKLKTITGVGSIPDGFAIIFSNQPEWHIVEVELSSHDIYEHVVKQVTKFMDGIENLDSKDNLFEAIWNGINSSYLLKHKLEKASGSSNPHWFLSNIIKKNLPIITLIIEKEQPGLKGTLSKFTYLPHKIVKFRTFRREGVGLAVHAHLFKPLYKPVISIKPEFVPPQPPENNLEVTLQPSYIESYCIYIPAAKKHLFPTFSTTLELDTDIGLIETKFTINSWGIWLSKGLAPWFKAHPELKQGDRVRITVLEPMKKYRLEILKEQKGGVLHVITSRGV